VKVSFHAKFLKDTGNEIELSCRDSTRKEEDVGAQSFGHERPKALDSILGDAQKARQAPGPTDLGKEHGPIAVANLPWARSLGRLYHLIASGENTDSGARVNTNRRSADGGENAKLLGAQHRAGLEDGFSLA
jgi:hypothetical protein